MGQLADAVAEFNALLAEQPHDLGVLLQLGLAEQRRGNLEQAVEWFDRARELDQ